MPDTSEAHRISIGIFHPILMHILWKKSVKTSRGLHTNKGQHTKTSTKGELFSWTACIALTLVYCLTALLLTKCMDVELNPGPNTEHNGSFMGMTQDTMEERFAQLFQCIHFQGVTLSRQMGESFQKLGISLKRIEDTVNRLKQDVCDNRSDINELLQTSNDINMRLDHLEKETERMDVANRQSNLKFLGIDESTTGNSGTDIDELVEMLNDSSSSRTYERSDIDHAHRLGPPTRRSRDNPRPLIVTFCRIEDKISILRDKKLRDDLRRKGVKVSADLTVRQREQIAHYREQGKVAYFRNGKLHVQDRDQQQHRNRRFYRNTQNDNQNYNDSSHYDRRGDRYQHTDKPASDDQQYTRRREDVDYHRYYSGDSDNRRSAGRQDQVSNPDGLGTWWVPDSTYWPTDDRELASQYYQAYSVPPEMWNTDMDYRPYPAPTVPPVLHPMSRSGAQIIQDADSLPPVEHTDAIRIPVVVRSCNNLQQEPVTFPSSPSMSAAAVEESNGTMPAEEEATTGNEVSDADCESSQLPDGRESSPKEDAQEGTMVPEVDCEPATQGTDHQSEADAPTSESEEQQLGDIVGLSTEPSCNSSEGVNDNNDSDENKKADDQRKTVVTDNNDQAADRVPAEATSGNLDNVSQIAQQRAGESPARARETRSKTSKTKDCPTRTPKARATRCRSQSNSSATRQTSLHSAWRSAKENAQR